MKNLIPKLCLMVTLCLSAVCAVALEITKLPDVKEGVVSIQTIDPVKDIGYVVGDILQRKITLTVKKPYFLVDESLPIVGFEKTYRGQPIGVYLSSLKHTKKDEGNQIVHQLTLDYQIFTSSVVAKRAAVLADYVRLVNTSDKDDLVKYRIPMWEFVISPLSVFGQIKVEDDMSQFRGPLLLNTDKDNNRLKIMLAALSLSLLGLLYIIGKGAWLPRMGGPFAKGFREIKKQDNTPQGIQNAISSMHAALNASAGNSLFMNNLDAFLAKKPAFNAIKSEIHQFFNLSRQVFFEPDAKLDTENATKSAISSDPVTWLKQFCRRCRDCERGLIADKLAPDSLNAKIKG